MRIFKVSILVVVLHLLWIVPASAQDTAPNLPPSVGIVDNSLVYFEGADSRVIFDFPESSWLYPNSLQWFNDEQITFRLLPDSATQWFVDLQGEVEQLLLTQPLFDLPVTFSDDLQTVYYASESGASYFYANQRYLTVIAQDINTGAQQTVGAILHGDGCGGGYDTPMRYVYDQESGYGGSQVFFEYINGGILYTSACTGSGISFLPIDASGAENFAFTLDNLSHISISPDGTKIAGVVHGVLPNEPLTIVIDLETHTSAFLQTTYLYVDQFGWGADGSLYFSALTAAGDLAQNAGYTEAEIEQIRLALYSSVVPAYEVNIYRYDLESDTMTELTTLEDAYGVARLFMLDGQMVASVIPSGKAWLDAILDGTLNIDNAVMMGSDYTLPYIIRLTGADDFPVLVEGVTRLTPRP